MEKKETEMMEKNSTLENNMNNNNKEKETRLDSLSKVDSTFKDPFSVAHVPVGARLFPGGFSVHTTHFKESEPGGRPTPYTTRPLYSDYSQSKSL